MLMVTLKDTATTEKFMPLMENKIAGAIFGTFICRFHISPLLSE